MAVTPPSKPLVAIVGATGTGKSDVSILFHRQKVYDSDHRRQLAVEIARQFDGEIINGDAMQLYKGLPVITNKITQDEMKGIPHHLLGRIGLEEETWTVGKFVANAIRVVRSFRNEKYHNLTLPRLMTSGVEANFQSWSVVLTITPSLFCLKTACPKSRC